MSLSRRHCLSMLFATIAYPQTMVTSKNKINTSMSTLQDLIDQAASGSTISIPPGQYTVDVQTPLRLKSDITLDLTGSTIVASPTNSIFYAIVVVDTCNNLTINNGIIKGEWDVHLGPTDPGIGGGGGGIVVNASNNVKIKGTTITDCFADGIIVLDGKNIDIDGAISENNRRQGMTVTQVDGLHVHNSRFYSTGGTPPGDGINLECDFETQVIKNVLIENNVFYNNKGSAIGLCSPGTYQNIVITSDNWFDKMTQPIWVSGNAGSLGTPWWAYILRIFEPFPFYRWWGYPTSWTKV